MINGRSIIEISIQPWFKDHCFDGKTVLPAVETMLLLAAEVRKSNPERSLMVMEDACFVRFLEIPPASTTMEVLVDCKRDENGSIHARLLSRVRYKTMARIFEHAEVVFPASGSITADTVISPAPLDGAITEIQTDKIYRELVPFGPAYQTLQGTLFLSEQGAWGKLKAPVLPVADDMQKTIGSPFPLDGALHAACVYGQQHVDFVPFPVGFERRIIHQPTQPGDTYTTKVEPVSHTHDELIFDLGIFDSHGQVFETVTGVRMRNVGRAFNNKELIIRLRPSEQFLHGDSGQPAKKNHGIDSTGKIHAEQENEM
jgi:hypothetical protein